ncbi:MerR family DNA-binding transcriptional regulator, partial [Bacillus albus]
MKQYKPKEFSEMRNVSVKTLQRWDNQGILPAYPNPKGRR